MTWLHQQSPVTSFNRREKASFNKMQVSEKASTGTSATVDEKPVKSDSSARYWVALVLLTHGRKSSQNRKRTLNERQAE